MKPKVLVITGPTAVGKTATSMSLAHSLHGEIISGDSMQVYQGMDIGTAKATTVERTQIPHHMIDLVTPDESFSVQDYQQQARACIADITNRGAIPLIVGGTGLYIESVIYEYEMPDVAEHPEIRRRYVAMAEQKGVAYLHQQLFQVDPESAKKLHPNDVRRVIRALEVHEVTGTPFSQLKRKGSSPFDVLWLGLTMPRELLYERINQRVDHMLKRGLIEEVETLKAKGYHLGLTSMQAIGYKEMMWYLNGEISYEEAVRVLKQGTRKYAKRQLSWFRRNNDINWFDMTQPDVWQEIKKLVAGKFNQSEE
ncbi:tRNA (adenosine(37)-N6)-dimethylallyltransferase MiaA [Hazenella sp. IB182357]|uniref:tRNA dimethylallyltransferase n=1 Tax=Polycladospora coralii TaxID=2771432 RepID=A0A926NAL4_9BACL|nr:tRNA (adenosine(37)-N6)-dimethylallyltransferase MiaA [Polycladospora coralii]MBD1372938.1 tRNA (adenosine(37)-N6)-dimethylallyltransferase MiaA [Polycladospora coralii]